MKRGLCKILQATFFEEVPSLFSYYFWNSGQYICLALGLCVYCVFWESDCRAESLWGAGRLTDTCGWESMCWSLAEMGTQVINSGIQKALDINIIWSKGDHYFEMTQSLEWFLDLFIRLSKRWFTLQKEPCRLPKKKLVFKSTRAFPPLPST